MNIHDMTRDELINLIENDVLLDKVKALEERNEELHDALLDDAKSKAMLEKLTIENGVTDIRLRGNIFHVFCNAFAETFQGSGATNYLIAEFHHEEIGKFSVTMQLSDGLTPLHNLNAARETNKALEKENKRLLDCLVDTGDAFLKKTSLNNLIVDSQIEGVHKMRHFIEHESGGDFSQYAYKLQDILAKGKI